MNSQTETPQKKMSKVKTAPKKEQSALAPVDVIEENIKEESILDNDKIFEQLDEVNELMSRISTTLSSVNITSIDAKRISDSKKKFDKSILNFNSQLFELYQSALKVATKSNKKVKKVSDPNSTKETSAVKKKIQAEPFLHKFLGIDDTSQELSRNDAYIGVTSYIRETREKEPETIAVEGGSNKEFKVIGKLKELISNSCKIIAGKAKILDKEAKAIESKKPVAGSKQMKELTNMKFEIEKLKSKQPTPAKMAFTDIMGYTNHCFTISNDDFIAKVKSTTPKKTQTK